MILFRFYNCLVFVGDFIDISIDYIIMGICKDYLNIELVEDEILRFYFIWKLNIKEIFKLYVKWRIGK